MCFKCLPLQAEKWRELGHTIPEGDVSGKCLYCGLELYFPPFTLGGNAGSKIREQVPYCNNFKALVKRAVDTAAVSEDNVYSAGREEEI